MAETQAESITQLPPAGEDGGIAARIVDHDAAKLATLSSKDLYEFGDLPFTNRFLSKDLDLAANNVVVKNFFVRIKTLVKSSGPAAAAGGEPADPLPTVGHIWSRILDCGTVQEPYTWQHKHFDMTLLLEGFPGREFPLYAVSHIPPTREEVESSPAAAIPDMDGAKHARRQWAAQVKHRQLSDDDIAELTRKNQKLRNVVGNVAVINAVQDRDNLTLATQIGLISDEDPKKLKAKYTASSGSVGGGGGSQQLSITPTAQHPIVFHDAASLEEQISKGRGSLTKLVMSPGMASPLGGGDGGGTQWPDRSSGGGSRLLDGSQDATAPAWRLSVGTLADSGSPGVAAPPPLSMSVEALMQVPRAPNAAIFANYITNFHRIEKQDRLVRLTERNSAENVRSRLAGQAFENKLQRKAAFQESEGLWYADDDERRKAADEFKKEQEEKEEDKEKKPAAPEPATPTASALLAKQEAAQRATDAKLLAASQEAHRRDVASSAFPDDLLDAVERRMSQVIESQSSLQRSHSESQAAPGSDRFASPNVLRAPSQLLQYSLSLDRKRARDATD